jgi:hypothetical protein
MPFNTVLLLLFSLPTTGMIPASHIQLAITSGTDSAVLTVPTTDQTESQKNNKAVQAHGSRKPTKQETQTLTGIVEWEYKPLAWDCDVPNCDHFALYDDATHTNYELDDARAALPYEGKRAKVTGVVNTKNSAIHLISIEALK